MAAQYDITLWELIRFRVQQATSALVEEIDKEISKDVSLREFWGEYPAKSENCDSTGANFLDV